MLTIKTEEFICFVVMYVGTFCICEAGNNMVITLENQHYIHYITQYSGNVQKIVKYNRFGEQQFLILTLCLPQGTK